MLDLHAARAEAADRYSAIAQGWLDRFGITIRTKRNDLTGRAWVKEREVAVSWPATTRQRLYLVAHEVGHIALDHRGSRPKYVQEFEAEQFAHALMREAGIAVPAKCTARAKSYVRWKITQAHRRGAQWIDPLIAKWAGTNVGGINDAPRHGKFAGRQKRIRYHAASVARVAALFQPGGTAEK